MGATGTRRRSSSVGRTKKEQPVVAEIPSAPAEVLTVPKARSDFVYCGTMLEIVIFAFVFVMSSLAMAMIRLVPLPEISLIERSPVKAVVVDNMGAYTAATLVSGLLVTLATQLPTRLGSGRLLSSPMTWSNLALLSIVTLINTVMTISISCMLFYCGTSLYVTWMAEDENHLPNLPYHNRKTWMEALLTSAGPDIYVLVMISMAVVCLLAKATTESMVWINFAARRIKTRQTVSRSQLTLFPSPTSE